MENKKFKKVSLTVNTENKKKGQLIDYNNKSVTKLFSSRPQVQEEQILTESFSSPADPRSKRNKVTRKLLFSSRPQVQEENNLLLCY